MPSRPSRSPLYPPSPYPSSALNPSSAAINWVTPKTVEVHLSHAYQKLDISSRRDLPTALGAEA